MDSRTEVRLAIRAEVHGGKGVRTVLWTVAILGATAADVCAQGWIEPGVDRGGFAVDRTRSEVVVRVDGRVAQIEVSEWFVNRGRRLAEGEYLYPLPGEAVFQGFSLFQGDAELRGEIMDAERARQIYEEIVRKRADPALIELAGHGLLRARIFPIQPGEERRVTLRYTQVLERAGNALQLVYAGAVRGRAEEPHGPRHERPSQSGSRNHVRPESVRGSFQVRVADASRFLEPFSPTHELDVERDGERMTVTVDDGVVGRLSLFLPLATEAVGLSVATHRPPGEDGYFMLTLTPGRDDGARAPRDVTVVLDVSGSMSGEKIVQARQALQQLLGTLAAEDRFRLISFSNAVQSQSAEWSFARGEALERARGWVDRLVADGGTNIGAALDEAFRLETPAERLPVVIFLTDGLPSIGEQSPERLAERAERRAGRARIFAFGVGHDVNTHLLDRLGEAGRGDTDYVQPGENVERAISLLATKIRNPVLTDLELDGGRLEIDEVYPVHIPDVFAGEELVLFGRFSGEGSGAITIRGERGGRAQEFGAAVTLPRESEANAYIPRLWAARKLGHLERQIWTEGETRGLVEEIRSVALRYGLPSRYTAYLVEEPDRVAVGRPIDGRRIGQANGFGQGAAPAAPSAATGAVAVRAAESARERRQTRNEADLAKAMDEMAAVVADREDARAVAGRLFTMRDGVWTDALLTSSPRSGEGRTIRVKSFTAAYFELLRALPELEPVLRELSEVVVAGERVSVHVGSEGMESIPPAELADLVAGFRGR